MSELLDVRVQDGVAVLTLNDPDRRNALTRELSTAILAAVDRAEADEQVRALVVTGSGRAFCAGADVGDLLAATEGDTAGVQLVYDAFGRIADSPLPTIAAVNGAAVGAGLNLALACDVRVMSSSARLECRFLTIGIHQGGGHAWMLERLVGPQTAAAMLLFGETVRAQDAVARGLAWSAVEDDELLPTALRLAGVAGGSSRELVTAVKDTLRTTPSLPTRAEALEIETQRQLHSLAQPAAAELLSGLRASISGGSRR